MKEIHIHGRKPSEIKASDFVEEVDYYDYEWGDHYSIREIFAFDGLNEDCVLFVPPGTRWAYRHQQVFGKFKNIEIDE